LLEYGKFVLNLMCSWRCNMQSCSWRGRRWNLHQHLSRFQSTRAWLPSSQSQYKL